MTPLLCPLCRVPLVPAERDGELGWRCPECGWEPGEPGGNGEGEL